MVSQSSASTTVSISSENLNSNIDVIVSEEFEISLNDTDFQNTISISPNTTTELFIRFSPLQTGSISGDLHIETSELDSEIIQLSGYANQLVFNYNSFNQQHLAFGSGNSQYSIQNFNLHDDVSNIETVKMYIKLDCPSGGCNAWDVYANILVKDTANNEWYELGRFITPYGVDNNQLYRGFEIDVTDFKFMLEGNVELKAFIEVWGQDGWNISVDFDYLAGETDYNHYKISRLIQYNGNSLQGVIYGEDDSTFDLIKNIQIGDNIESAHLRTIITGWGHATPNDSDGRPCAEWCFRTHNIKINNINTFNHFMGPIGCGSNNVSPQNGNWSPDRAGWCPGMEVPIRIDIFDSNISNTSFEFEYDFQDWINNLQSTASNPHAYYAISTFIILKSNQIIEPAIITD
jgi:hypothetical protein